MKPCIRRQGMEDSLVLCIHSLTAIPWCDRQYSIPLDQRQRRAYNSSLHWDEFTQIPAVAQR